MKTLLSLLFVVACAVSCAASGAAAPTAATPPSVSASAPAQQRVPAPRAAHSAKPATALAATTTFKFHGTNLSGAEFGSAPIGTFGVDYTYPTSVDVDYFTSRGFNLFRIPFMWERLQNSANAAFNSAEQARLVGLVTYVTNHGGTAVIEDHNSARYFSKIATTAEFGNFMGKLGTLFKANPNVWIDLTNEPNSMTTESWVAIANAGIAALRSSGFTGRVMVEGNGWTGADSWSDNWYGTPNATAMLNVVDSANNLVFEVHNYFDSDGSGNYATGDCLNATVGSTQMKGFVAWLRANKKLGYLGEFGTPNTATCKAAVTDLLNYAASNNDVLAGWTWWSAGPWWGNYILSISPYPYPTGPVEAQLTWLTAGATPCQ